MQDCGIYVEAHATKEEKLLEEIGVRSVVDVGRD